MAISKKDRQKVFDKFGGRCAYCGCELTEKWHVDHMEPVIRYKQNLPRVFKHFETGEEIGEVEYVNLQRSDRMCFVLQEVKYVSKTHYPERNTSENLTPACISCNMNKGGAGVEGFRHSISNGVKMINNSHAQYRMAKRFGLIAEHEIPVVFYFESIKQQEE